MASELDVAKRIKELRESKKITQTDIAAKLGMVPSNYSRLETKGNRIVFEQIEKIAEVLEVSVKELLFGEQDTSKVQLKQQMEMEIKMRDVKIEAMESKLFLLQDLVEKYKTLFEDERNLKQQQMTLLGEKMIRRIFEGRDAGQSKEEVNNAINDYIDEIAGK